MFVLISLVMEFSKKSTISTFASRVAYARRAAWRSGKLGPVIGAHTAMLLDTLGAAMRSSAAQDGSCPAMLVLDASPAVLRRLPATLRGMALHQSLSEAATEPQPNLGGATSTADLSPVAYSAARRVAQARNAAQHPSFSSTKNSPRYGTLKPDAKEFYPMGIDPLVQSNLRVEAEEFVPCEAEAQIDTVLNYLTDAPTANATHYAPAEALAPTLPFGFGVEDEWAALAKDMIWKLRDVQMQVDELADARAEAGAARAAVASLEGSLGERLDILEATERTHSMRMEARVSNLLNEIKDCEMLLMAEGLADRTGSRGGPLRSSSTLLGDLAAKVADQQALILALTEQGRHLSEGGHGVRARSMSRPLRGDLSVGAGG